MGNFFKSLAILMSAAVILAGSVGMVIYERLPDSLSVKEGTKLEFSGNMPITIAESGDEVKSANVSMGGEPRSYDAQIKLMGLIPIKSVNVDVVTEKKVILCGTPFGIKIFTDGVMVVGISPVNTGSGTCDPAKDAGLNIGDIIESVDGVRVYKRETVARMIESSAGETLNFVVRRERTKKNITFSAAKADDGSYKAGMWIRDSSAGIGTLTYIDPNTGAFGGLGHGICDIDTGQIIPISTGEIVNVALTGVCKSSSGEPGELRGYLDSDTIGEIALNNEIGVYGKVFERKSEKKEYTVALKQEVREGKAQIISTIPGSEPAIYDIEIDKVNYDEKSKSKNLVIKVTDPHLLEVTGGIVQGMSGSPIIQNGKFIGAVTHVFVNDPTLGYGIFAENMLKNSVSLDKNTKKTAS